MIDSLPFIPNRFTTLSLATALLFAFASKSVAVPDFQKDVAPLMRQYCAGCHNDEDFEGDYSIERYADLVEGGSKGSLLKAGDAEGSRLIKMMTGGMKLQMPPRDDPQPSEDEKELLKSWITAGAIGPKADQDVSILSTLTVPKIAAAKGAKPVTAMAASPDGKRLAVARFREVSILDVSDNNKVLKRLPNLSGKINEVHFTQDGKRLLTASGIAGLKGIATLWDLKTGKAIVEFGEGYHRDVLYDAELSPDGKILATAGYDTKIGIWDVASGKRLHSIDIHNGAIYDLAFSPDGQVLASASADQTVKLWRVDSGQRLDTLNQPQGEQLAVVFTPDGKNILAAGADNRIRLWRFISRDKAKINPLLQTRFAHEGDVVKLALTADGKKLLSSGDDRAVKVWALPDLTQLKAWDKQSDVATALALSGDSLRVARMDGSVGLYSLKGLVAKQRGQVAAAEKAVNLEAAAAGGVVEKIQEKQLSDAAVFAPPLELTGVIDKNGDEDELRFSAKAGESWVVEVDAAQSKSPLDSRIAILDAKGTLVERVRLQAVRDSWFTFRGKDSNTANDFRVHNWREMELNEYLYANGEVVKLWLYPRGPDSGFKVYPGFGKRKAYFGTTALAHPLGEPCYIVKPIPVGVEPTPNGLPVYKIYYENDDDSERRLGKDSQLVFTAPKDGQYRVKITDVRGFGGKDYRYTMKIRRLNPDFEVTISESKELVFNPGSGREFEITVLRKDGFEGELRVDISDLPEGFSASTPVIIQAGQHKAAAVINVAAEAPLIEKGKITLKASAFISGKEVTKEVVGPENIEVKAKPKLLLKIAADGKSGKPKLEQGKPMELTIHAGETITALVIADRKNFKERIDFGKEESGRNLAHGLIIDNIGSNGLMILKGENQQRFFITASKWVSDSTRYFHLRTKAGGGHATLPIVLHVKAKIGELAER